MKQAYLSDVANSSAPYEWEGDVTSTQALRFDTNTLPFPPPGVRQFAKNMMSSCEVNEYVDPSYAALTRKIAEYESVSTSNITITNSGDEAIDVLAKACLNPGDTFVTTPPTYEMYAVQCIKNRGINTEVPLQADTYDVDCSTLIQQGNATRCNMLFLCSPNNPTGSVISRSVIKRIIQNVSCLVVVDETYREFGTNSCVNLLPRCPNLVILRSFSKFAGLAGARIGYLIASENLSKIFNAIKLPMGVSYLSSKLAECVLSQDQMWIQKQVQMILSERKKLISALRQFGFTVYPSRANFVLVNMGSKATAICRELKNVGILVRNRSTKPYLENCVRITIRSARENIQLIAALKEIV